jgi:hypothetical protein
MRFIESQPEFQRIMSLAFSGAKSKPSWKLEELCLLPASFCFLAWVTLQP